MPVGVLGQSDQRAVPAERAPLSPSPMPVGVLGQSDDGDIFELVASYRGHQCLSAFWVSRTPEPYCRNLVERLPSPMPVGVLGQSDLVGN